MSARQLGMQLPPHGTTDGVIEAGPIAGHYVIDDRIPRALYRRFDGGYSERAELGVVGHSPYTDDACRDGRHLFDIIESRIEHEIGEPHTDEFVGYEYEFHARLTCVRCGVIREWEGRRTENIVGRIAPAPIVAGDLVAQQVHAPDSWGGRDMSTWVVFRDGAQVGFIQWASGKRGRAFHVGRLEGWPDGQTVEGADPARTLKKLAAAMVSDSTVAGVR